MTVADALAIYGRERAPHLAAPERVAYAIDALLPFLGSLPIADISGTVCRRYQKDRGKAPGTVRKELGTLAAAINYCHAEGYLTGTRKVTLPAKPPPRDRWLTRDEAARLLWAAYRNPKAKHLARFILIALYTGTRSSAILGLRFMRHTQGGWIDTERGLIYRRGAGQVVTKKRQPVVPVPPKLLAHLRRWERNGRTMGGRVRGAACRQRQASMGDRPGGYRDRALHPVMTCAIPLSHGRCSAVPTNGAPPVSSA